MSPRAKAAPKVPPGTMASPQMPFELMASPSEAMEALSMMEFSDAMPVEMSEAVIAKMAETVLSEMMPPAVFKTTVAVRSVFKVTPVDIIGIRGIIIRIIPIGDPGYLDIVASIPEIIITTVETRWVIKYFFGPY
jgi:hypothetical protein